MPVDKLNTSRAAEGKQMRHTPGTINQWLDSIQETGRGLTKWEQDFVESIGLQLDDRGTISDRQEEILERIYAGKTR